MKNFAFIALKQQLFSEFCVLLITSRGGLFIRIFFVTANYVLQINFLTNGSAVMGGSAAEDDLGKLSLGTNAKSVERGEFGCQIEEILVEDSIEFFIWRKTQVRNLFYTFWLCP